MVHRGQAAKQLGVPSGDPRSRASHLLKFETCTASPSSIHHTNYEASRATDSRAIGDTAWWSRAKKAKVHFCQFINRYSHIPHHKNNSHELSPSLFPLLSLSFILSGKLEHWVQCPLSLSPSGCFWSGGLNRSRSASLQPRVVTSFWKALSHIEPCLATGETHRFYLKKPKTRFMKRTCILKCT